MRDTVILVTETLPAPKFLAGDVGSPEWFGSSRILDTVRFTEMNSRKRSGCYTELFTFCRMDRKLQCDPSPTRQHLVYLLAVDAKTSLDRVRDTPPCIHTLCVSCEIPLNFRTDVLSRVCHPHGPQMRRLAWVRAAPFQACSNRGSIKVPEIIYDPPPLLVIFKFARVQWQWEFSIIGPPPPPLP